MKPSEIYDLYVLEVKNKQNNQKLNHVAISPLLDDMYENDKPMYDQLLKLLNAYKRNLCERIMEGRQQNLSFDYEEEI